MHAKIVNGSVVEWPIVNLRKRLPELSLPEDMTDNSKLPEGFVWVAQLPAPGYNPNTHKLVSFGPELQDGSWVSGYTEQPLSDQEASEQAERVAAQVRADRNRLLAESDWTQTIDSPVDKTAWAAYRQELRDVTAQSGFPFSVQWPVEPGTAG